MKSKVILTGILCLAIAGLYSCGNMENKSMDATAKNKETCQKIFDAFDKGDADALNGLIAENAIDHTPDPEMKTQGLAGAKEAMKRFHAAFPDMKSTIYSMTAEGDMVTVHYNMKGTNSGTWGTMPATNKPINVDGVDVIKLKDGIAVEHWGYSQEMKMMTQLGQMSPPAGTAEMSHPEEEKK